MPPPPPQRTTPVLLPLVLRTIGPVLDARSLAWALASSTGTWSGTADCRDVNSCEPVARQLEGLGSVHRRCTAAARLARPTRCCGVCGSPGARSAADQRAYQPMCWQRSGSCLCTSLRSGARPTLLQVPMPMRVCLTGRSTFQGSDSSSWRTLAVAFRSVEALSIVVNAARDRLDAGADHSAAAAWLRSHDVPAAQVRPIPEP